MFPVDIFRGPLAASLLCVTLALTACSSTSGTLLNNSTTTPTSITIPNSETPIPRPNRNPILERNNDLNKLPIVANDVVFLELEEIRRQYLIPEDTMVAPSSVRETARAFGAAIAHGIREPQLSSVNMSLPGHPRVVSLPAALNVIARAALYAREATSGADVGPSFPDATGRIWVAVFMGASGPIGAVRSSCVAVTLRSDGRNVLVELVEVASEVTKQPLTRRGFASIRCVLDLEPPSNDGFLPQT